MPSPILPATYRKLTHELIDKLAGYIAEGNYAITACALAGISQEAYYSWLRDASSENQNGNRELLNHLTESIQKAEAIAEEKMVSLIRNTAVEKKDGYLGMTFLERRHPERWGRKDRLQVDKRTTVEVTTIVKHYSEIEAPQYSVTPQIIEGEVKEIE